MHTHFGSATTGFAAFLSFLLFGTFWKIGWLHIMSIGARKGSRTLQSVAKAALFQYGG